jgi:hypothetical protein
MSAKLFNDILLLVITGLLLKIAPYIFPLICIIFCNKLRSRLFDDICISSFFFCIGTHEGKVESLGYS